MFADDEIVREFLVEGRENLDRLERELVAFEQGGASTESIDAIFRTVHTIKGTSGFFGFTRLQGLTHVAENVLSMVRDGQLSLSNAIVTALLAVVDACQAMMLLVESTGGDGTNDHAALIATLEQLQLGIAPDPTTVTIGDVPLKSERAETTVRVDVGLLDKLVDLAGELVLERNQLARFAKRGDAALVHSAQRLDRITSELQDNVMRTRMQPIAGVWNKLPRIVRDLSGELGKHVRLELEGKETGLDRSLLEAIKDPLTHLVRNAIDHGIEDPEHRLASGKPAEGVLRLRACHEGGHVVLEIADDGAGIDREHVRAKAVERGIVALDEAARMSEREVFSLLFAPGFSTAATVTSVSGRGVGMDVVKTNIDRIGGAVEISSIVGAGTTIRIKIPLTLAIIPALIVTAAGERYAIAQNGVLELVRIDPPSGRRVEHIDGTPVYRRRGELLPLVYLEALLGLGAATSASTIVVLENEGRAFGLVVDAVQDNEEIVVKPTGKRLRALATYAGATILGDGRVALILDVRGLATRAGLGVVAQRQRTIAPPVVSPRSDHFLIVRLGAQRQVAVSLDKVLRLEELSAGAIEFAAGLEVLQYRDGMLPLIRLADALGETPDVPPERLQIVVYTEGTQHLGLVVDGIVDIVERSGDLTMTASRHGFIGSAVVAGRVTDFVDIRAIASSVGIELEEAA